MVDRKYKQNLILSWYKGDRYEFPISENDLKIIKGISPPIGKIYWQMFKIE